MRLRFVNQKVFMQLVGLRNKILTIRSWYLKTVYGMNVASDARISFKARLDKTNPKGLTIGSKTLVAFDAILLAHDYASRRHDANTKIGTHCFIGCGSLILPNINIGNHVIVAAGSVVTKDVPSNSIVAGNPAKIIKTGIETIEYGMLSEAYLARQNKPIIAEKNTIDEAA